MNPLQRGEDLARREHADRERYGRELKVFGVGHITCAETDEEAQAEYRRVIFEHGDWDAAKVTIGKLMAHSQTVDYESSETKRPMEGVIRAFFAHPLTGSPETIVGQIKEMADASYTQMAADSRRLQDSFTAVARIGKPVVAAIHRLRAGRRA